MSPLFGGSRGGGGGDAGRTAEQRERDRWEREARRARREGREPPPEPAGAPSWLDREGPVAAGPSAEPVDPRAPSVPEAAAEPPAPDPVSEPEPEPFAEPEPDPAPSAGPAAAGPITPGGDPERGAPTPGAPTPGAPASDVWIDPVRDPVEAPAYLRPDPEPTAVHDLGQDDEAPEPTVRVIGGGEEPLGTKRVAASAMASAAGAQAPPRFGAPPKAPRRRRRARRVVLPVVLLLPLIAIAFFAYRLFEPFKADGTTPVQVVIPEGSGTGDIAEILADRGVVSSAFFFELRARIAGDGGKLRSGTITLDEDMPYSQALSVLTERQAAAPVRIKVTVPEGQPISQTARTAKDAGLTGSYTAATRRRSSILSPSTYGAESGSRNLEGFLWPATYDLEPGSSARGLVNAQLRSFKENFASVNTTRARERGLTRYDVLIIASMIEREAAVAKDRRLISAVIYNRLKQDIPLGIDATIRYRLDNFSSPLKQSELETDSAYNTRRRQGLPPTPIGNPGLASLRAAANPAKVSYLYYVVRPCGNGAHAFSRTDAEFQQDVAAYNRKRAELGGKDPSRC